MPDPIVIVGAALGVLAAWAITRSVGMLKRRRGVGATAWGLTALLLLVTGLLCATIAIGLRGYRALTREELAATIRIRPSGRQKFVAEVTIPDGATRQFALAGDQVFVDAHILKWRPIANLCCGLHTDYALDRVGGRYIEVEDERARPRTIHALGDPHTVDLFQLRRRFAILSPLFDAEYGSGTFVAANEAVDLHVLVSTSGLLVRQAPRP